MSVLNDRLTIDGTYYVKKTRDQIIPLTTAPATGLQLGGRSTPVRSATAASRPASRRGRSALTNGFSWNTTFNYLRNRSRVDSLAPGLATIIIASQWSSNIEARQGQPYGVLFGYALRARLGHRQDAAVRRSPDRAIRSSGFLAT